jgi:hypothetical protein
MTLRFISNYDDYRDAMANARKPYGIEEVEFAPHVDSQTVGEWQVLLDVERASKAEQQKDEPADVGVIADRAKSLVNGDRQKAYGAPEDNFARIARFWTAYFHNTGRNVEITASDVSPMMRLLKEARLCDTPDHADSHIDLIGYALTGARVNKVKIPVD